MKTYIQPQTSVIRIETRQLCLQLSIVDRNVTVTEGNSNVGLVKENRSSRPSYNVWDDDWSN